MVALAALAAITLRSIGAFHTAAEQEFLHTFVSLLVHFQVVKHDPVKVLDVNYTRNPALEVV